MRCRFLSLLVAWFLVAFFTTELVGDGVIKIQGFQVSESRQKSRSTECIKLGDDGRSERPFLKSERT